MKNEMRKLMEAVDPLFEEDHLPSEDQYVKMDSFGHGAGLGYEASTGIVYGDYDVWHSGLDRTFPVSFEYDVKNNKFLQSSDNVDGLEDQIVQDVQEYLGISIDPWKNATKVPWKKATEEACQDCEDEDDYDFDPDEQEDDYYDLDADRHERWRQHREQF